MPVTLVNQPLYYMNTFRSTFTSQNEFIFSFFVCWCCVCSLFHHISHSNFFSQDVAQKLLSALFWWKNFQQVSPFSPLLLSFFFLYSLTPSLPSLPLLPLFLFLSLFSLPSPREDSLPSEGHCRRLLCPSILRTVCPILAA